MTETLVKQTHIAVSPEDDEQEKPLDPQLSAEVTVVPEAVELQHRLLEVRDELDSLISKEILDFVSSLGIDIDISTIKDRLARTRLVLCQKDSPVYTKRQGTNSGLRGFYNTSSGSAFIAIENNEELFEAIVNGQELKELSLYGRQTPVHERFHSLAGDQAIIPNPGNPEELFSTGGLRKNPELIWLDEAVTEDLTLRLLQRAKAVNGVDDIPHKARARWDRAVLDLILEASGLDRKDFYEAYFEDSEPSLSGEGGSSKWQTILGELDKKFGPDYLSYVMALSRDKNIDVKIEYDPEEAERLNREADRQRKRRALERQDWARRDHEAEVANKSRSVIKKLLRLDVISAEDIP